MIDVREIRHFHLFCGLGGGARGFNRGHARVGNMVARFRCLGGVDVDPEAVADFERLAGVPGTAIDLFSREQYRDFHGREPGPDWREAGPADLHRAAGGERPHIVFLSAPCKGFSGLLPEATSRSARYQALNGLTLRGVWLMLEAWADDPPELVLFENVPRIASRGRHLIDQIKALLATYGHAVAETTHDCGRIGGLAQTRKRFLLVARHREKVPPFLYEPAARPLRGVGDVIGRLPVPGEAGGMHRLPALQWKTWVRLAFVEAGSDWRSLNRLKVQDGALADYGLLPVQPRGHSSKYRVTRFTEPANTVIAASTTGQGAYAVADPRVGPDGHWQSAVLGVTPWEESGATVSGRGGPTNGAYSVADPRIGATGSRSNNVYRVVRFDETSPAVTGGGGPTAGGLAVADPRPQCFRGGRKVYVTGGHYGVLPWDAPSGAVTASGQHDNGRWSVADPRPAVGDPGVALPRVDDRLVAVIRAMDGTWHRPFTTLELAALQGLVDPDEHLELAGLSDSGWRERIGNAVPPPAAAAIAGVMGRTLLLAWSGETFALSAEPIWVRPVAVAAALDAPSLPLLPPLSSRDAEG